jgi:hypothetical protein
MENFFRRKWYVKFTVVFIIPMPWVRMEEATDWMLMEFRCFECLSERRSRNVCWFRL